MPRLHSPRYDAEITVRRPTRRLQSDSILRGQHVRVLPAIFTPYFMLTRLCVQYTGVNLRKLGSRGCQPLSWLSSVPICSRLAGAAAALRGCVSRAPCPVAVMSFRRAPSAAAAGHGGGATRAWINGVHVTSLGVSGLDDATGCGGAQLGSACLVMDDGGGHGRDVALAFAGAGAAAGQRVVLVGCGAARIMCICMRACDGGAHVRIGAAVRQRVVLVGCIATLMSIRIRVWGVRWGSAYRYWGRACACAIPVWVCAYAVAFPLQGRDCASAGPFVVACVRRCSSCLAYYLACRASCWLMLCASSCISC